MKTTETNYISKPIEDGGPAFPNSKLAQDQTGGMSLRDYFAAHLPITEGDWPDRETFRELMGEELLSRSVYEAKDGMPSIERILQQQARLEAKIRYIKADAMLRARKDGAK